MVTDKGVKRSVKPCTGNTGYVKERVMEEIEGKF